VWASADLNRFIRAYASGRLIERSTKLEQRSFIPGCGGEPPGPGQNSAGLALYQYETNCGTVLGYAGNFPAGYTLLIAATPNGRRSTVVFANEQLAEAADTKPEIFKQLRRAFRLAACAALPR
jgi:D-alanyl-D-alanine carboxypeptidase